MTLLNATCPTTRVDAKRQKMATSLDSMLTAMLRHESVKPPSGTSPSSLPSGTSPSSLEPSQSDAVATATPSKPAPATEIASPATGTPTPPVNLEKLLQQWGQ
jgi:hypothetical protein